MLSTVGVVITTVLTGLAAQWLFDLTWLESMLLGAVVASTDAAAVFATLRFTRVRRRLARTLEAETGGNDPMAVALTIGLFNSIMFPVIFTITLERSSASEEATSGLLCTAIIGGAFVPLLVGFVSGADGLALGYSHALVVPALCYGVLCLFALAAGRALPVRKGSAASLH